MDRSRKTAAIVIAVIAVLALGWLATRSSGVEVTVATVTRDTLSVPIVVEGKTRARDLYTVTAPITGRVSRLVVEDGDMVEAGQRLAMMFPAPDDPRVVSISRAQVAAAQADLARAASVEAEAAAYAQQSEHEVTRRRPLAEIGGLSNETLEQFAVAAEMANQRLEAARAGVAASAAALTAAQSRLGGVDRSSENGIEITAPVSGRVLRRSGESERVVAAGSPLLELANTGGLEVVLDVLSEDAVLVVPGQRLVITTWGGEGYLEGSVRATTLAGRTKISALGVEEQRVDILADLVDAPASLGTGYRVQGEITVWSGADVTTVPTSALFRSARSWRVFRIVDGKAEAADVVIGHRNDDMAEVISGLDVGDEVILFPSDQIEDGAKVRVASAS